MAFSYDPFFIERDRRRPRPMMTQHIGLRYLPNALAIHSAPTENYCRSWRNFLAMQQDTDSTIKEDKEKFQVNLDVQHFGSEEISVKISNGFLVVEAKHEEKEDEYGFISRSFTRRCALPEGVEDNVTSSLSSDGVLTITALKHPVYERIIPIIQTGPVKKTSEEN